MSSISPCRVRVLLHREPAPAAHFDFDAPPGLNLVLAARQAGLQLPASCRNGTCRACMCRLVDGEIDYLIEWPGLLAEEKQAGWFLPCVARARGDLVIEQPAARVVDARP
ncbi:MAG: hypothetical protein RL375_2104 [Pseudomonadota bacterium]